MNKKSTKKPGDEAGPSPLNIDVGLLDSDTRHDPSDPHGVPAEPCRRPEIGRPFGLVAEDTGRPCFQTIGETSQLAGRYDKRRILGRLRISHRMCSCTSGG